MSTYDAFLFFNEMDILEIRLNNLDPFVDKFVLVESPQTFSGKLKPLWFQENKKRFEKFLYKIIRIEAPKSNFVNPWDRETFQRNMLLVGLKDCAPNDIIMVGDVDEIPGKGSVDTFKKGGLSCVSLNQPLYIYYINGLSDRRGIGTVICYYSFLLGMTPHSLRLSRRHFPILENAGWHFSYLGGPKAIVEKVAAYSHQEENNPAIINVERIAERMKIGVEPGRRDRTVIFVPLDETFPKFILENKERYPGLIKEVPEKITPDKCMVIVATSFVRLCHPCTKMVERSIRSLKRIFGSIEPKLLFSFDYDPNPRYIAYKERMKKKFTNATFLEATNPIGFQGVLKQAVEMVTDPLVLVWQHDFEMILDLPFELVSKLFMHPIVKYVRMSREKIQADKWNKILDGWKRPDMFVCGTSGWSDNPHFARTDYYRNFIIPMTRPMGGSVGVEGFVWTEFDKLIQQVGFTEANKKFGSFIFGAPGDAPNIRHLIWKRGKKPICVGEGCERGN